MGYQKAGFRGHQYLLEEGEYADWSHWGGYDEALTSLRVIRTVSKNNWAISLPVATAPHPRPQYSLLKEEFVPSLPVLQSAWKCSLRNTSLRKGLLPFCCFFPSHTDRLTPKSLGGLRPRGLGTPGGFRGWAGEILTIPGAQDFGDPAVVLFEAMDFEGHGVEVREALPDVELARHGPHTQAIHVLSGV